MHELVSFSQLPALREAQVLNILAGVTGTQPVDICEQRLIFAQVKVPEVAISKKQAQTKQQPQQSKRPSYEQLVRSLQLSQNKSTFTTPQESKSIPWHLRTEQTPSASTTATRPGQTAAPYIVREVALTPATPQILLRLTTPSLYAYKYQYILLGHRFVHGNIVIRVYRLYYASSASEGNASGEEAVEASPPQRQDLKPVDESGSWIVDATVRVEEGAGAEVLERGKRELERFRQGMEGCVDLKAGDRLSLDVRAWSFTVESKVPRSSGLATKHSRQREGDRGSDRKLQIVQTGKVLLAQQCSDLGLRTRARRTWASPRMIFLPSLREVSHETFGDKIATVDNCWKIIWMSDIESMEAHMISSEFVRYSLILAPTLAHAGIG
ncbi:unnamed protein product [Zymoseptoria tritici ST99CH_3D1]|nr:unnamed protein product [Zymoseptoria tritici ST99CH_3D1]